MQIKTFEMDEQFENVNCIFNDFILMEYSGILF